MTAAASSAHPDAAAFPDGSLLRYGKRIGAFVLYLLHCQLLPGASLRTVADLFGVRLVTATIARISQDCAHRFMDFAVPCATTCSRTGLAYVTGFRIGG